MKLTMSLCLAGLILAGCSKREADISEKGKPVVYAVNYPLAYFAERIGRDNVTVVFPEMEGDPAFWEPTADQIAAFQQADLILLNGAAYAKWVPKVALPHARLVDSSAGFNDRYIALDGAITHAHGPGGAHAHGDLAFTTWLDPQLAALQAAAIYETMARKWNVDRTGYEALLQELQQLHEDLLDAFGSIKEQPLIGSHPVYQYLIRAYDLNMESVHWEPDAEPDEIMWRELEDILEAHHARIMLWEDEPLPETKAKLAERGIESVVFNPCGNRPDHGDFMDVMRKNVEAIRLLQ